VARRVSAARVSKAFARHAEILITIGSRISDVGFVIGPYTPAVLAAVQAAHIHTSTAGRRAVELTEELADTARECASGVQQTQLHAVSPAVSGTGAPFNVAIHFWTAAPSTITASTIMMVVQIVRIQPSMLRAGSAPTASG